MAKKPDQIKPIFPLKHEYIASLDRLLAQTINLRIALKSALDLDQIKEPAKTMLAERLKALDECFDD